MTCICAVKWREQRKGLIKLFQKKRGSGSSSLWMRLYAPWAGVHFQICNLSIIKQWAAHIDAYLPKCVTQFPKQQLHLNILSRKKRKSQTHEISAHQTEVWYKYDKRGSDKKKKLEEEESWIFFFWQSNPHLSPPPPLIASSVLVDADHSCWVQIFGLVCYGWSVSLSEAPPRRMAWINDECGGER